MRRLVLTFLFGVLTSCGQQAGEPGDAPEGVDAGEPADADIGCALPANIRIFVSDSLFNPTFLNGDDPATPLQAGENLVVPTHATWGACWEGQIRYCATFSVCERTELVLDRKRFTFSTPDGRIENAGTTSFARVYYGAAGHDYLYLDQNPPPRFTPPGWPTELGWGSIDPSDGSFSLYTLDPTDLVVWGTGLDGSYPVWVVRNMVSVEPVVVDLGGAQPLRTATLDLPGRGSVRQQLFTSGQTRALLPSSSSVRYTLPAAFEAPGDQYTIDFEHGAGTYVYLTTSTSDVVLNPDPMPEFTGLTVTNTLGPIGSNFVVEASWDPYPDAVGYILIETVAICCNGPPRYRDYVYYVSNGSLELNAAGRYSIAREYYNNWNLPATVQLRAVTSSAGAGDFPLGWTADQPTLRGYSNPAM